jgi:cysteine desulfurase
MVVYFDNNATTKPLAEVAEAMRPYLHDLYGNPSSPHQYGQECRRAVEDARASVAALIEADAATAVVFTSCATESINHAFHSAFETLGRQQFHIVTSSVEHAAVLQSTEFYRSKGADVSVLGVDAQGNLNLEELDSALVRGPAFVSLMLANNETGVIFPIEQAGEICRRRKAILHVDAVQAIGKLPVNFGQLRCDFLSLSAHKFHGPKGVGALFIRHGAPRIALLRGHQEGNARGGTENVPGIVGMGAAARIVKQGLVADVKRIAGFRDALESGILARVRGSEINGNSIRRLCNTTNIHFPKKNSAQLVERLSAQQVFVSAGAACTTGGKPSHVLKAMGLGDERANGSLRFSLSKLTTREEIERALALVPETIKSSLDVFAVS